MTDLDVLLQEIDALSSEDLKKVLDHIMERRVAYWIVPGEHLAKIREILQPVHEEIKASGMTSAEVDDLLDDALQEVRRERRAQSLHMLQPPSE
jgi:hypothetical protein